jgi:hypothetical protein
MALGRSGNVNDIGGGRLQHFPQIGETLANAEALAKLPGHKRFPIANGNNLTIRNTMDGLHVLIGNLAATDYGNAKHCVQMTEDGGPTADPQCSILRLGFRPPAFWHHLSGSAINVPNIWPIREHFFSTDFWSCPDM